MLFGIHGSENEVNKVARSTAEIFAELYEQNISKVLRYISYRVSDMDTAEDITSIVFEKALGKFDSFRAERASFSTWVLSIARNAVTDHYRAMGKEQEFQQSSIRSSVSQTVSPDDEMVKTEELNKLKDALSGLNAQEKEIIAMKFGGELTNREIAKSLGLSDSNVGIIIYRTVRKLRDSFGVGR
ncbi:MAG: sigma-70 family RNA polymerase sigma factor [Dehalococcoidales bacterium]|nr:sigma-70 family RNA polymerase sigma factor [Dehalococcoidales bacterium]